MLPQENFLFPSRTKKKGNPTSVGAKKKGFKFRGTLISYDQIKKRRKLGGKGGSFLITTRNEDR